jgi:hypothetical protein
VRIADTHPEAIDLHGAASDITAVAMNLTRREQQVREEVVVERDAWAEEVLGFAQMVEANDGIEGAYRDLFQKIELLTSRRPSDLTQKGN